MTSAYIVLAWTMSHSYLVAKVSGKARYSAPVNKTEVLLIKRKTRIYRD